MHTLYLNCNIDSLPIFTKMIQYLSSYIELFENISGQKQFDIRRTRHTYLLLLYLLNIFIDFFQFVQFFRFSSLPNLSSWVSSLSLFSFLGFPNLLSLPSFYSYPCLLSFPCLLKCMVDSKYNYNQEYNNW